MKINGVDVKKKTKIHLVKTIVLNDPNLYDKFVEFFSKYARNSAKFSVAAFSQGNESFNINIVRKVPKSRCYSKSELANIIM